MALEQHIIQELAIDNESSLFIGFDLSTTMLKVADENTPNSFNIGLIKGDGDRFPFLDHRFDRAMRNC